MAVSHNFSNYVSETLVCSKKADGNHTTAFISPRVASNKMIWNGF